MSADTSTPHRVVVVGSGFGGLFGTRALDDPRVSVTVIAATSSHLFQPLLYQVATGILSEGEIAPPTREILAKQRNAEVVLGTVTDIDIAARTVTHELLGKTTVTEYDSLILAAGSGQSYFGHPEFAQFAPGMKSIDDALELRGRILGAFEAAEAAEAANQPADPAAQAALLTFVVVGAGATGVEMTGQIVELAQRTLRGEFRRIDPARARIVLVDGGREVLAGFDAPLGKKARTQLEKMGVEVHLNAMVDAVDERGVELRYADGHTARIEAATKIWAAGVEASGLGKLVADQAGAAVDKAGRVAVEPDLTLPGHPEVFIVGDMIGRDHLPGVCQVAIQSSRYAAARILSRLDHPDADGQPAPDDKPFSYFDKGSMATISKFRAIAQVGPAKITGFPAWVLWLVIHLFYLIGFKNRVVTLLRWAITFLGNARGERTITHQQTFGRQLIAGTQDAANTDSAVASPERTAPSI